MWCVRSSTQNHKKEKLHCKKWFQRWRALLVTTLSPYLSWKWKNGPLLGSSSLLTTSHFPLNQHDGVRHLRIRLLKLKWILATGMQRFGSLDGQVIMAKQPWWPWKDCYIKTYYMWHIHIARLLCSGYDLHQLDIRISSIHKLSTSVLCIMNRIHV